MPAKIYLTAFSLPAFISEELYGLQGISSSIDPGLPDEKSLEDASDLTYSGNELLSRGCMGYTIINKNCCK